MGGTRFSDASYAAYDSNVRSRTADPVLSRTTAHTADISSGLVEARVHQSLSPNGVTLRESRDSVANPNALGIMVVFDVTGSMGGIPVVCQRKLKTLMRTLIDRGYVADPQILFAGIGDATCDRGPMQVGQFESDIQMDEDLSRMWLEGGGGGQTNESYELAYYFAARHTATDCWEKRQQKGYLFTIGDEHAYLQVQPSQVRALFGSTANLDQPVSTADMLREAEQRWHVFHILADTSTSRRHASIGQSWRTLLGDRVLALTDPDTVAELVALTIGLSEGRVDVAEGTAHLQAMGVSAEAIAAITEAVSPFARAIALRA